MLFGKCNPGEADKSVKCVMTKEILDSHLAGQSSVLYSPHKKHPSEKYKSAMYDDYKLEKTDILSEVITFIEAEKEEILDTGHMIETKEGILH